MLPKSTQAWPEIEGSGISRSSDGNASLDGALSWAQLLPRSGRRQFQYNSNFPQLLILPFLEQFPLVMSEGEGFFSVSVGPSDFSVRHYSSQKELINIQIASSFTESFGGESNTSVKTVSFGKVRHNRLAFLTTKAWVNFFGVALLLSWIQKCLPFRFCCFVLICHASTALSVPFLFSLLSQQMKLAAESLKE